MAPINRCKLFTRRNLFELYAEETITTHLLKDHHNPFVKRNPMKGTHMNSSGFRSVTASSHSTPTRKWLRRECMASQQFPKQHKQSWNFSILAKISHRVARKLIQYCCRSTRARSAQDVKNTCSHMRLARHAERQRDAVAKTQERTQRENRACKSAQQHAYTQQSCRNARSS